jgi:hypothetical protein
MLLRFSGEGFLFFYPLVMRFIENAIQTMPEYTYHFFNCTQWVDEIGGYEQLNEKLLKQKKGEKLPTFIPPKVFNFQ